MRTSDELDPDLVTLLHRAAGTMPGYGADLTTLVRRRRARRNRQVLLAGLAAAVAVAVLVAGAALVRPDSRPAQPAPAGSPMAQRLFVTSRGVDPTAPDHQSWGLLDNGGDLGEVLSNGQLVTRKVPGLRKVTTAVPLPDGGLVALGEPTTPASTGTATIPGMLTLSVLRPDGSLRLLRNEAGKGLFGADAQQAYLYGGDPETFAIDLTTGQKRTLPWGTQVPIAVGGGHAIVVDGDPPNIGFFRCSIRVLDAASGSRLSEKPTVPGDCEGDGVSLSPDGTRLALVESLFDGGNAGWSFNRETLIVLDVTTGAELVHKVLEDDGTILYYGGLCWSDPDHVRVVWFRLPMPPLRLYTKAETMRQATVAVPRR